MRKRILKLSFVIVSTLIMLSLSSCGDSYKAKSMAKDFLNENLTNPDMSSFQAGTFGKTSHVSKEQIMEMRKFVSKLPEYKNQISYTSNEVPDTVTYLRVNYNLTDKNNKETKHSNTFYFDKELTHILGFTIN